MSKVNVFKNLKVLELSSVLAGPAVGMFFAELGAQVLKIENPTVGGDVTRRWKTKIEDSSDSKSAYYHCVNWNKKVEFHDLKNESILNLIKEHDIIISNFKSKSAIKLGLDYETVKRINPGIIFGKITAFGNESLRPGFDVLMQAETGWIHMTGNKSSDPAKMPVALIDIIAAHQLKEGILIALLQKQQTGNGALVSVSLYDAAISALANQASNYLNLGLIAERKGTQHPNIAPYGDLIETADKVLYVLATGTQKHFVDLCNCLGLDHLVQETKFATNEARLIHRNELMEFIKSKTNEMSSDQLKTVFNSKGIPIGEVKNLKQVFEQVDGQKLVLTQQEENGTISKRVKTAIFNIE